MIVREKKQENKIKGISQDKSDWNNYPAGPSHAVHSDYSFSADL